MADAEPPQAGVPEDVPRSPTGRIPKWVIDEAQGRSAPGGAGPPAPGGARSQEEGSRRRPAARPAGSPLRTGPVRPQRPGRPRRDLASLLPALVAAVVVVACLTVVVLQGGGPSGGGTSATTPPTTTAHAPAAPTPGIEEADHVLGRPPVLAKTSPSYRFAASQPKGTAPVAYDPCRPVHYVIRAQGAPTGGEALVADAVAQVSKATGLVFRYDGTSTEAPAQPRVGFQPDRYGNRWAPVLVAFVTAKEDPTFASDVAGEAGSMRVTAPGRATVYVTGQVELDADKLTRMLTGSGGHAATLAVIEHELGHLVGLTHVDDPTQLMFPQLKAGVTGYGDGDLTGLAALGQGACVPDV